MGLSLLCYVGPILAALPLGSVVETMRPLPIQPLDGAPPFVLGVSIIRGVPTPVVDAGMLLGTPTGVSPERFVSLRAGDRLVALVVERIVGVHDLPDTELRALPPLLAQIRPEVVSAMATLDSQLVLVLRAARVVPESVWRALATDGTGP